MSVERVIVACPTTWPAKTVCKAWGAPGSHGCRLNPGHAGICICACNRKQREPEVET